MRANELRRLHRTGWRNIPISLKTPEKGEERAQACANAWFRKLTKNWLFPFSRVGLIRVALGLLAAVCKPALVSVKLGSNVSICLFSA